MVIIDFIDMMSRADKLAMLEELEIALEPDKAKPQVGQLSDLGLVELTRHRQGQSLSEIFTKKCPHCQGSGYFMNEFNFATPTAEGEYRAKAAKLKLPMNNFKKNNKNNQPKPQEGQEVVEQIQEPQNLSVDIENPSVVAVQETDRREKGKKRGKKNRFEKPQGDKVETPLVVTEDVQTAQTVIKANEEIKPEIVEHVEIASKKSEEETTEPKQKGRSKGRARGKKVNEPSENPAAENTNNTAITVEQPREDSKKKTRRPNRGTSKRIKRTTKKNDEE